MLSLSSYRFHGELGTFHRAEEPASSYFRLCPQRVGGKGSVAVLSPLAHIFQPFGEKASSSVKIPIPEKGPRLTQRGQRSILGQLAIAEGHTAQTLLAGAYFCRQGVGKGGGDPGEPGRHH